MRTEVFEMYLQRRFSVLLIFGLLLGACMGSAGSQNNKRLAVGLWGGPHVNIDVGSESAKVEYDCAHGEIHGPLVIDDHGKFHLRGTFTPERGGPVRAGDSQRALPATYSGEINGNKMTLDLRIGDSDEIQSYTLEQGKPGRLVKCK
jgi:hypothetical protein